MNTIPPLLLDLPEVCRCTSLSKTSIYYLLKDSLSRFPKPIKVPGLRRVAWRAADVQSWVEHLSQGGEA